MTSQTVSPVIPIIALASVRACQLSMCKQCLSLIMFCVDDNEGAGKALTSSLPELSTCLSIHAKCCSTYWCNLSFSSLPIASNKGVQIITIKAILLLTINLPKEYNSGSAAS